MERSWWWKAALFGAVVVLSCLYLVPSVVPQEKQPAVIHEQGKGWTAASSTCALAARNFGLAFIGVFPTAA